MAKQQKELEIVKPKVTLPESLSVTSINLKTIEDIRYAVKIMKEMALNSYLLIAKIDTLKAYDLLGYESIDDFIETELKGVISLRNAKQFLDYVYDKTDNAILDDATIVGLLEIYKEEKANVKSKQKDASKSQIKDLNLKIKSKEEEVLQKEIEIEELKEKLDEMARSNGIDPDRVILVKSEDDLRRKLDSVRVEVVESINSLRSIDADLLSLVGSSDLQLTLGAIKHAIHEVEKSYSDFLFNSELAGQLDA